MLLTELDRASPALAGIEVVAASAAPDERADAARLKDVFRLQVLGAPLSGDVLRLLSPRAVWRFLARRLGRGAETAEFARRLEDHLGLDPVPPLGQRLRRLGRSVANLSPRKIAAYRALLRVHRRTEGGATEK
jgi:hypothetical protein